MAEETGQGEPGSYGQPLRSAPTVSPVPGPYGQQRYGAPGAVPYGPPPYGQPGPYGHGLGWAGHCRAGRYGETMIRPAPLAQEPRP